MLTIPQAFDQLRRSLELTPAEQSKASDQQNVVRDNLRKHLGGGIVHDSLSGSYARGTAIRPLHDIDIFVVLDPTTHRDVYPTTNVGPSACLNKVLRALEAAYPNKDRPKLQGRSVNIVFTGTGIGFDVVPAFETAVDTYMIPDRDRSDWIQTRPEAHRASLVRANEAAGSRLNPRIKMMKQWKAHKHPDLPLRSFHVEVMACNAATPSPAPDAEGMQVLFAALAKAVLVACPEPAKVGPHLDKGMTQAERTRAREALVVAEAEATRALGLERAGRVAEAHGVWKGLFGAPYP